MKPDSDFPSFSPSAADESISIESPAQILSETDALDALDRDCRQLEMALADSLTDFTSIHIEGEKREGEGKTKKQLARRRAYERERARTQAIKQQLIDEGIIEALPDRRRISADEAYERTRQRLIAQYERAKAKQVAENISADPAKSS